ncbi:MAG: response regulator [Acidimicrobiia bacterium]|nr:response regulator [Acidimicrobiia bacterium]
MTVERSVTSQAIPHGTPGAIGRAAEILLVEDNPADAELAMIGLRDGKDISNIHIVHDGEEAWEFLRREGDHAGAPRPDIVLLDLNLPGLSGVELLRFIKADEDLRSIPVIVLTTSDADHDVRFAYAAHANAYMVKPVDFQQFHQLLDGFKKYWLSIVCLPQT